MPPRNPADRPATEPRTDAGRRLLAMLPDYSAGAKTNRWQEHVQKYADAVLAIEVEAAQGAAPRAEGLPSVEALALAMAACGISDGDGDPMPDVAAAILTRLGAAPRAEGLDQIIVKMRRFAAARRRDGDKPVADSQATAAVVDSWANQLARLSRPSDEREGADR